MSDITWRLVVTIIICTCGAFTSLGYFGVVSNNLQYVAQPFFNTSYNEHFGKPMSDAFFSTIWPLAASIYFIGAILGSLPIGIVAEKFGRRNGLMLHSIGTTIFSVVSSISPRAESLELYIMCRLFLGFFCGLGAGILPMYLAEISPTDKRGIIGSNVQIFVGIGLLGGIAVPILPGALNLINFWPAVLAVPGVFSLLETIWLLFCPGSPRHLYLTLNQPEKAKQSIAFFQGPGQVDLYMKGLQQEKEATVRQSMNPEDHNTLSMWGVICDASVRRNLIVSVVIIIGMQMDGSGPVFGFSHDVFLAAGMSESSSQYASAGVGVSVLASACIAVIVMEKAGRRKLILLGYICQLVCLLAIQVCNVGIHYWGWQDIANYCLMGSIYIFVGGYSIKSCVVWVAVSELFPQKARSGAMSLNMSVNWTLNWVTMFAFLPWEEAVHSWWVMPFIVSLIIINGIILVYLPETAGKELGATGDVRHELDDFHKADHYHAHHHDQECHDHAWHTNVATKLLSDNDRHSSVLNMIDDIEE